MGKMNHALLYGNYEDAFAFMNDAQVGRLVRAMLHFLNTEEELPLKQGDLFAWSLIKDQLKRNMEKYDEVCEKNRQNSRKYWDAQKAKEGENKDGAPCEPEPKTLENTTVSDYDTASLMRLRDAKRSVGIQ